MGYKVVVGAWLSLVERYLGVVEVVGSNPAAPTNFIEMTGAFGLVFLWPDFAGQRIFVFTNCSKCVLLIVS